MNFNGLAGVLGMKQWKEYASEANFQGCVNLAYQQHYNEEAARLDGEADAVDGVALGLAIALDQLADLDHGFHGRTV